MPIDRILFALLLLGCSRTTESSTTPPTATDAAPPFVVRIHRWGGGPAGLNHTLEITPDGAAHLTGLDTLWCRDTKGPRASTAVDTRVRLDPAVFTELRQLSTHPEVTRFAGAPSPARAPATDGVAAEVMLPNQPLVLVDGVREVNGKMGRLLDLDREIAARYGAAAACK